MKLLYKPDFERAKKAMNAYWEKEVIGRPCIAITVPSGNGGTAAGEATDIVSWYGGIENRLDSFERMAENTLFLAEAVPFCPIGLGPDQFAAFMGARLEDGGEYHTSWVKSCVEDWEQFDVRLDFSPDGALNTLKGMISYAAKRSENKYLIGMIDLHSNMDALSALRGPQNLCLDLYDVPETIDKVIRQTRQLYKPVYEQIYAAGEMQNRGSIGWIPMYSEGRFATIQCDYMCMLSREHFRRYVLEALIEEAESLDRCVFHYDGKEALTHLDDILSIKAIDAIQWVPGAGQPRTVEWMDLLKKIQAAGKGLYLYDWTIDEIKAYRSQLRPEGLFFHTRAESADQAEQLLEHLTKTT